MNGTVHYMGWDIGGAHLKLAGVDGAGRVLWAEQFPVALWQGLEVLRDVLVSLRARINAQAISHALTMTGELVDAFSDRAAGVHSLLDIFQGQFPPERVHVYGAGVGLVPAARALECWRTVASANWHATGSFAAGLLHDGILVDVGSTTTDILAFAGGNLICRGMSDQERLREDELVYSGVTRTPVMAIVRRAPFAGAWQNLAAELFATTADVYRIRGELDESHDQMPSADGAGKTVELSVRRLARMLGADAVPGAPLEAWRDLADFVAERQFQMIDASFSNVYSRLRRMPDPTVVGAGCGRFVARRLAARHNLNYVDFPDLLAGSLPAAEAVAACATAVAAARLLQEHMTH